jgi:hypothetical protein
MIKFSFGGKITQNGKENFFMKKVSIKLSGIVDCLLSLSIDISWTYGKLKNRI